MARLIQDSVVVACPDCDENIDLGLKPILGQKVRCSNCWSYLEVIALNPVELGWDDGDLNDLDWNGNDPDLDDWDDDDWDDMDDY